MDFCGIIGTLALGGKGSPEGAGMVNRSVSVGTQVPAEDRER